MRRLKRPFATKLQSIKHSISCLARRRTLFILRYTLCRDPSPNSSESQLDQRTHNKCSSYFGCSHWALTKGVEIFLKRSTYSLSQVPMKSSSNSNAESLTRKRWIHDPYSATVSSQQQHMWDDAPTCQLLCVFGDRIRDLTLQLSKL